MLRPTLKTCRYKCRLLQITDELWLCPHTSYGPMAWKLGAVEEARRLLERAGGYQALLERVEAEEARAKADREDAHQHRREVADSTIRAR